jgi:ATPase subunit of ABC transporter with duplicated ATPase domains
MTSAYRFTRLSLSSCPPVGTAGFEFSPGLNLVVGENGSGRSALLNALASGQWPHGGEVTVSGDGDRGLLARYAGLVTFDERVVQVFGEERPLWHWSHLALDNPPLMSIMERLFNEAMAVKLGQATTKFARVPYCGHGTLSITVDARGHVAVHAGPALAAVAHESPYGSVEQLFVAAGERILLNLCGVLAAREWLGARIPLLLDCPFASLDGHLRAGLIKLLHSLTCQVIVTAGPWEMEFHADALGGAHRIELPGHAPALPR